MRLSVLLGLLLLTAALPASQSTFYGPTTFTAAADTLTSFEAKAEVATIQVSNVTGTAGVQLQGTLDGSTWVNLLMTKVGTATVSLSATANGVYQASVAGMYKVRAKALYMASGVARIQLSTAEGDPNMIPSIATTPTP